MLELVRSTASLFTLPATTVAHKGLVVGLAQSPDEIELIQRLRFDVFSSEFGAVLGDSQEGIDRDAFDPWCEHLMVKELGSDHVVGTYRILTPHQARRAGGYYSESEFDLSGLGNVRNQLVEFGRACIHEDYRQGSALMMLWSGLAEILKQGRYEHVFGCASVSLRDDGNTAARVWRQVRDGVGLTDQPNVTPLNRYPFELLDSELPAEVPALLKGYLKLGARVCGEPAWDPDFNTADFPMLLSVSNMGTRYRRHFGFDKV
ncbi:MAG: GNAT family N-acyltransferase [Sheuella sp.]|nr:GNAT family N-acyltransferase [Sheuella sp.]